MGEVTIVRVVGYAGHYDRSVFACGKPDLDVWLQRQASQQERKNNTRTFLALDTTEQRVIGYYSTTTYRLDLDEAAAAYGVGKRVYPVPAVLLARLAVDQQWSGQGVGRQLLVHALENVARASEAASNWLYLYPQIVVASSEVSGFPVNGLNSQFYVYNITKA